MGKTRQKEGYVYIISNKAFPKFYKIGVTHDIQDRLRTYQTSAPHRDYKVEYYIKHPDCYKAEQSIKEMMKYFALERKNEWYMVDLNIAISRLDETLTVDAEYPISFEKSH
jgi:predicted GIY-YIG superfamily endonuclease